MEDLLSMLVANEFISGETICQSLSMTRAAVWKRIEKLRAEGYQIQAAGKRGYHLEPEHDVLLPAYVKKDLDTTWAGQADISYAPIVPSTNTALKQMANEGAPHGSLALCDHQSQGRGRLGRSWEGAGSALLAHSLLLRPSLPVEQAPLCTLACATAMAEAIEIFCDDTISVGIKWPNDLIINGKKCAGILSELSADMDQIHHVVVGIGVNVNQNSFEGALSQTATSLRIETKAKDSLCRRTLLTHYLSCMEKVMHILENQGMEGFAPLYQKRSVTLKQSVRVVTSQDEWIGTAQSIDDTGALLVMDQQGTLRRVLAGDVSVRGLMGYC